MPNLTTSAPEVVVLPCIDGLCELADAELVELQRAAGAVHQQVGARLAAIAGELARRSDRALGHSGLASRLGAASAEKAIQSLTGVSFSEARALANVGKALDSPWLAPVGKALTDGGLSVAAASAITSGLGSPSANVAADDLQDAAAALVGFAEHSTPEHTARAARQMRDQLDVEAIEDLEAHRRAQRSLKWFVQPDGNVRIIAVCDPESAALILNPIESVMSPRRGGPRFVDEGGAGGESAAGAGAGDEGGAASAGVGAGDEATADGAAQRAQAFLDDPRTNDQLALDTLVDIVKLAVRASGSDIDATKLFGKNLPAPRVHVRAESLRDGKGVAYIEGQAAAISVKTAQRYICDTGYIPIIFRQNKVVATGETMRLHSVKDRIALAAQWNGCPVGDCDRPASMTEAHHIEAWNGSNTTLENGICLCRFHHMELHANGWQIRVHPDGTHWIYPPPNRPGTPALGQKPQQLRSRSPFAGI